MMKAKALLLVFCVGSAAVVCGCQAEMKLTAASGAEQGEESQGGVYQVEGKDVIRYYEQRERSAGDEAELLQEVFSLLGTDSAWVNGTWLVRGTPRQHKAAEGLIALVRDGEGGAGDGEPGWPKWDLRDGRVITAVRIESDWSERIHGLVGRAVRGLVGPPRYSVFTGGFLLVRCSPEGYKRLREHWDRLVELAGREMPEREGS